MRGRRRAEAQAVGDRIVLIAYHFPPDPAVGSLRASKVAHAFRDIGSRVDVVTARLPGESATVRRTDDAGLIVHPVKCLPHPRELLVRLKAGLSRLHSRRNGSTSPTGVGWAPPSQVAGWKRLLSSLLWLPDDRQAFILPAWRKAHRLVREGARLVYTTAPPYSPHLVGLALGVMSGARWVMELRDPWADNDQKPWWVRARPTDALDARLERHCLERADLVVAVSDGIRTRLVSRLPTLDRTKLLLVRNGIERLRTSAASARPPGPVRIAYVGTFYHSRDPRPFLRALAAVCRAHGLGPDRIRVDFIGACRSIGGLSVQHEIDALGLTSIVKIQDWLPHAAANALIDEADVLLLLAQQQPDQVPNKLYEYLGARRPILAFADREGETARMLHQVGGHRVVTSDDDADARCALEALVLAPLHGCSAETSATGEAVLEEWTTEVQMQRLIKAVRN